MEKVKPKSCPKCGTKREQYDPRLDGSGRIVWDKCPNCGYDYCGHEEKVKPKHHKCAAGVCAHYRSVAEQLHYDVPYCQFGYAACASQDYRRFSPMGTSE